jgi:hypothetical protein
MESDLLEVVDAQNKIIKIQSDLVNELLILLMQHMAVEAEEMKYNPSGELFTANRGETVTERN